ncbi:hypothetical protein Tco_0030391 [Tanacetum coccineum]
MKAWRYLSRGCYAFIAHVIDTSFKKKSVEDVSVVIEFLDVFLEDLPGIPPERQVEFRIDLIPGATPIAKTSNEEREVYLREVLETLRKDRLYAKLSKCEFWLQEVQFLSHIINSKGLKVDPAKIEAIMNWQAPKNIGEI